MNEYVKISKYGEQILVIFDNEEDKPFLIGEKMCELREEAYMNGYNWDAFFQYYLENNAPDILDGLESDPEAGSYAAYYEDTPENEVKAQKFAEIICYLIEHEEEIYKIITEQGDEIEWD